MATAALLRSIRRREVASAPFSAYKCLSTSGKTSLNSSYLGQNWRSFSRAFSSKPAGNDVIGIDLGTTNSCVAVMEGKIEEILDSFGLLAGNAQASLGSSYTGQNYASLCRAFGSKAGVNDIVGTGMGTTNTSNAIREEREHSKATENAIGAHLRSLGVGTPRRMLSTISGGIKTTEEEQNSPKIQSFRPLSPHLTVYQPQMNSMLSIFNRISGIYLTGVFFGGYLLYLKMGMICLTYPGFYQVLFHVQQQLPVITSVTALAALYHTIKSTHSLLTH